MAQTTLLTATNFVSYYSYAGALAPSGAIGPMVTIGGTTQTSNFNLAHVDVMCIGGAGTAANSCGIHIHTGTSCADDAGGHLYDANLVGSDPWASVAYTSDATGAARGAFNVTTGIANVDGRTMIIHDYSGGRVACAILYTTALVLDASDFVPYYTFTGGSVTGRVGPMTEVATTQTFAYTISGVDPLCSSGPGAASNSCGMHIHSGTSCSMDAGGHYYTGTVTTDPWTSVTYTSSVETYTDTSSSSVHTSGTLSVTTGGTLTEINGRTFIIHAFNGSRIACAILAVPTQVRLTATAFVPYYSYSGDFVVGGTVGVTTAGTAQTVGYSLTGIDPACSTGAGTAANSCGGMRGPASNHSLPLTNHSLPLTNHTLPLTSKHSRPAFGQFTSTPPHLAWVMLVGITMQAQSLLIRGRPLSTSPPRMTQRRSRSQPMGRSRSTRGRYRRRSSGVHSSSTTMTASALRAPSSPTVAEP